MTKIQQSILDTIAQSSGHQTAEQVLASVRGTHPTVSLSTVYRNLNAFSDMGKIRRIERAATADCYERNLVPHEHAHCVKCDSVSDFSILGFKDYLEKDFGHPILSFDLVVNYICDECLSNLSETKSTDNT